MAEGTYEYECMRAELLGLAHPSREEFEAKMKLRQETEAEEQLTEQLKEVDLQEESVQGTSGKMDELNSILTATQQKINKFKVACGSLTSLLKLRPSTPSNEPAGGPEGKSINDALDTLDTMKDLNAASDATVTKAAAADLGTKVTSQLGKLDSLLYNVVLHEASVGSDEEDCQVKPGCHRVCALKPNTNTNRSNYLFGWQRTGAAEVDASSPSTYAVRLQI